MTQLHPISVIFTLPEDDVARVMRQVRAGAKLTVRAYDRGDAHEIATGRLDTVDNQIDTTTGTVKLRALFDNADEELFPNQFVNAKLTVDTVRSATLVPNASLLQGTPGTYVYLMDGDNKVTVRPVKTGETDGTNTVVASGPQPGRPRRHRRHRPAEGRRPGPDHRGRRRRRPATARAAKAGRPDGCTRAPADAAATDSQGATEGGRRHRRRQAQ